MNHQFPPELPPEIWAGPNDGPGPEHARWHSVIRPLNKPAARSPGIALIGLASDEGVRRDSGRLGTKAGPDAIRRALAPFAIHDHIPRYDAGTITVNGEDLESAQEELATAVAALIQAGHLPIVLGGGHEAAFGSHLGLRRALHSASIVNLDAHFDLRTAEEPSSDTPFKQIADLDPEGFDYTVIGISRPGNTEALHATAIALDAMVINDDEIAMLSPLKAAEVVFKTVPAFKNLHLSIDLDVLPAHEAPGVSSPATLGVPMSHIRAIAMALAATGHLKLIDVVELNPSFDLDARTAKAAARLIDDAISTHVVSSLSR
ncbi:formimidoylglutamase [Corynebacterium sp. A21]|uniref:formimidoylglutamase n=1 Tax=Corynebacterium sp. A21 TaxID=3457318 RepID=UPI003FD3DC66